MCLIAADGVSFWSKNQRRSPELLERCQKIAVFKVFLRGVIVVSY